MAAVADEFAIERAGPLSLDLLAALHGRCFDEAWSRDVLARLLAMPGAFALLAVAAGRDRAGQQMPVGFAIARTAATECEVLALGILPEHRGRGAGRALVDFLLAEAEAGGAREIFLEVSIENVAAETLYQAAGFTEAGRRPGYYRLPDGRRLDAILMRRGLGV